MAVSVERVDDVDDDVVAAFARLIPQLSRSAPPLGGQWLKPANPAMNSQPTSAKAVTQMVIHARPVAKRRLRRR